MQNTQSIRLVKAHQHSSRVIRCNAFDEVLREVPVSVAFYYKKSLNAGELKLALEAVLESFDLFAGRLSYLDGDFCIDCRNQGVRFSTQDHDFTMTQLLRDQFATKNNEILFDLINPKTVIKKQEAVLTIKVNYFEAGGMCLGLTWHHAIGDMQTFMSFMRAWSDQFSGRNFVTPLVVSDRHQHLVKHLPRNNNQYEAAVRKIGVVEAIKLIYYMQCKSKAQRWVQFYFSEDELNTMYESYRHKSDSFLSVNDVLSAHILSVFTDTFQHKGQINPREMDMAINFRNRAGLDENLMGNMVSTVKMSHKPGDSAVLLAQRIRHKVDHFESEYLDYHASLDYIEKHGGREKIAQFIPDWLNPYGNSLLLTSWANFGVYDIDFGIEKPFYFATMGPALFPWITSIVEGPNNKGLSYVASIPQSISDDMIKRNLLGKINQFRDPNEVIPELVQSLVIG